VDGVEVEVCTNGNGKYFVRHNVYWWIEQGRKNPDQRTYNILKYLQDAVDILSDGLATGFRLETL